MPVYQGEPRLSLHCHQPGRSHTSDRRTGVGWQWRHGGRYQRFAALSVCYSGIALTICAQRGGGNGAVVAYALVHDTCISRRDKECSVSEARQ